MTITLSSGQTVTKTCEKLVSTNCTSNLACDPLYYFHYQVNSCNLTITAFSSGDTPATWNFGDNTPPVTLNGLPTHTYTQSGTYYVTVEVNGRICGLWITVFCEPQICCTASFTANIYRDCGVLRLSLDADCNTGKHQYTITPIGSGTCFDLVNFQSTVENQTIQITNINTGLVTGFQITHNYICADGQAKTQTRVVNMPTPATIFVGIENQTTNLTNYNCVLPGNTYNNTNIVYVSGFMQINKTFTFVGSDIQFHPGLSGFDIYKFGVQFQLKQNTRARGVADCNCMWRGMNLKSLGRLSINTGSSIEDAVQGILVEDKVPSVISLKLDGAKFFRNFVGIQGLMYLKFSTFQNTLFDGEGPLKNICTLNHTIKAPLVNNIVNDVPFNPQQGFAGIYIKNSISPLTLPFLTQKNLFNNLAYGILAFDTDIDIDRNSRFTNITGTVYGTHRNAAIALIDGEDKGPNTFKFRGTNIPDGPSGLPDFDMCWYGIVVKSLQSGSPTKVGITNALMDHMRTGIFLDSRSIVGAFLGTSTTSGFTGIRNNRITATLTSPSLFTNAGISTFDYNSMINNIQIANNVVTMRYGQGVLSPGSAGIAAAGVDPVTDPGANLNEKVDIFDNRILIEAEGEIGIGTFEYPRVSIRNHRDNGNGIFHSNPLSKFPGIKIEGGTGLIVSCNDVTATSSSDEYPLLYNFKSTNSNFLNNRLTGNGIGITIKGICTDDNIRCNEMQNNRVGLSYIDGAITGPQGSLGLSYGNLWFGSFTIGAEVGINGVNAPSSPFYVRPLNNEMPPSLAGPQSQSWFKLISPNAPINCLASCPLPSVIQVPVLTKLDSLIATNQVDFGTSNLYAEKSWQCQFDLFRTLTDYPNLAQNNTLMQGFLNSTNVGNIAALLQVQRNMRNAFAFSNTVLTTIQTNNQTKAQISLQIQILDSLIGIATDSAQLSVLYQQRIVQDSLFNLQLQANETLTTQHDAQSLASVPSLLAQLNAITPTIVCETNLKRVMEIYLQTLAFGVEPTSSMVSDVYSIAIQCVNKGGIGVLAARSMYYAFTAIWLNEANCVGDRNTNQETSDTGISIFPNPTAGTFAVQFPDAFLNTKMTLTIVNAIGSTVQHIESEGNSTKIIDLSTQPNGLYFAIIRNDKGVLTSLPILLQH